MATAKQAQAETKLGLVAKEYMARGEMLPTDLIVAMTTKRLAQRDCAQNGWILDGERIVYLSFILIKTRLLLTYVCVYVWHFIVFMNFTFYRCHENFIFIVALFFWEVCHNCPGFCL